jgi:hypothetical protein
MKTFTLTFIILVAGIVANGQIPASASKSDSALKIQDSMWIANGGEVYSGGWGGAEFFPAEEMRFTGGKRQPVDCRARVLLQNTGGKTIKAFDLDFIFLDPQTNVEFLRYRFHAKKTMKAGAVKEFSQQVYQKVGDKRNNYNPVRPSIDVLLRTKDAAKDVRMQRIEYADGSVWERP